MAMRGSIGRLISFFKMIIRLLYRYWVGMIFFLFWGFLIGLTPLDLSAQANPSAPASSKQIGQIMELERQINNLLLARQAADRARQFPATLSIAQMRDATVQLITKEVIVSSSGRITREGGGTGVVVGCSEFPITSGPYVGKYSCYVLTVGHLADPNMVSANALVYKNNKQEQSIPFNKFLAVNKAKELAFARVYSDVRLPIASLASRDYVVAPGQPVIGIGCPDGATPFVYSNNQTCVASVEYYKGVLDRHQTAFTSIITNQRARLGASGGPLYDTNGRIIGVLSSRSGDGDPEGERTWYVHVAEIYDFIKGIKGVKIENGNVVDIK